MPAVIPIPRFVHRTNIDGMLVSFCSHCYCSIAISRDTAELERAEQEHICDPATLEHFNQERNSAAGVTIRTKSLA
jgi:hypothetical protein